MIHFLIHNNSQKQVLLCKICCYQYTIQLFFEYNYQALIYLYYNIINLQTYINIILYIHPILVLSDNISLSDKPTTIDEYADHPAIVSV